MLKVYLALLHFLMLLGIVRGTIYSIFDQCNMFYLGSLLLAVSCAL